MKTQKKKKKIATQDNLQKIINAKIEGLNTNYLREQKKFLGKPGLASKTRKLSNILTEAQRVYEVEQEKLKNPNAILNIIRLRDFSPEEYKEITTSQIKSALSNVIKERKQYNKNNISNISNLIKALKDKNKANTNIPKLESLLKRMVEPPKSSKLSKTAQAPPQAAAAAG